jgi:hypothetical protein
VPPSWTSPPPKSSEKPAILATTVSLTSPRLLRDKTRECAIAHAAASASTQRSGTNDNNATAIAT